MGFELVHNKYFKSNSMTNWSIQRNCKTFCNDRLHNKSDEFSENEKKNHI